MSTAQPLSHALATQLASQDADPSSAPQPPPPKTAETVASSSPPTLPDVLYARVTGAVASVLSGAEFVGEVLADALGITASPYQYVLDAKEREERRQKMDDEEEEAARSALEQRLMADQAIEEGEAPPQRTPGVEQQSLQPVVADG